MGVSFSNSNRTPNASAWLRSTSDPGSALVPTGSGSDGRTYVSRRERGDLFLETGLGEDAHQGAALLEPLRRSVTAQDERRVVSAIARHERTVGADHAVVADPGLGTDRRGADHGAAAAAPDRAARENRQDALVGQDQVGAHGLVLDGVPHRPAGGAIRGRGRISRRSGAGAPAVPSCGAI